MISSDMIFDRLNDKKFNILLRYHIISHMRSHWHKRSRYPTHNSSVCSWYDIFHLLSTRLLYFSFANSQIYLFLSMTKEDLQSLLFRNMHWISKGLQDHSYVANVQKQRPSWARIWVVMVLLIVCLASLQSSAIRPRWITRWVKTIIISPASLLFDHIPSWWNLPLYIILYYISLTFITTTNYENLIFQANEEDQIA